MSDESLSDTGLEDLTSRFVDECKRGLDGDPPMDCEALYAAVLAQVRVRRRELASAWMNRHFPRLITVESSAAGTLQALRDALRNSPGYLSEEERARVSALLQACQRRLEELEVEALFSSFKLLSADNQVALLGMLRDFMATRS